MSSSAVSGSSLSQPLQSYLQTRKSDLQQLGEALSSGNLANAQTAYNSINTLGQGGPFSTGHPFISQQREQDFNAIGEALESGDLAGAQQAFATLESSFYHSGPLGPAPAHVVPVGSGPEIVLNLSNGSYNTTPGQTTINNSNEQIGLNLVDSSSSCSASGTSSTSAATSGGLSVSA